MLIGNIQNSLCPIVLTLYLFVNVDWEYIHRHVRETPIDKCAVGIHFLLRSLIFLIPRSENCINRASAIYFDRN